MEPRPQAVLTYEGFPEDNLRRELIDGELIVPRLCPIVASGHVLAR